MVTIKRIETILGNSIYFRVVGIYSQIKISNSFNILFLIKFLLFQSIKAGFHKHFLIYFDSISKSNLYISFPVTNYNNTLKLIFLRDSNNQQYILSDILLDNKSLSRSDGAQVANHLFSNLNQLWRMATPKSTSSQSGPSKAAPPKAPAAKNQSSCNAPLLIICLIILFFLFLSNFKIIIKVIKDYIYL
jgi:hypothetical protein